MTTIPVRTWQDAHIRRAFPCVHTTGRAREHGYGRRLVSRVAFTILAMVGPLLLSGCSAQPDAPPDRQASDVLPGQDSAVASTRQATLPQATDLDPIAEVRQPPISFDGTASPIRVPADGSGISTLVAVRTGSGDGFDRLVLEFEGSVPGYTVRYLESDPVQCGSGATLSLGSGAVLEVQLEPANAHSEEGAATIQDRDRMPRLPVLQRARLTCDFEAHVDWALLLRRRTLFRAFTLESPARLVIDVAH